MRKILKYNLILIAIVILCFSVGCDMNDNPSLSIVYSLSKHNVFVGDSIDLDYEITGDISDEVTWSVSNDSLASITEEGVVSFIKKGEVTVACSSGEYMSSIKFSVSNRPRIVDAGEYIINSRFNYLQINVDDVVLLTCTNSTSGIPADGVWTTSGNDIISLSNDGILKGLKQGSATVNYSLADTTYSFTVEVKAVTLDSIVISGPMNVNIGESITLAFNTSDEVREGGITWSTSDRSIATIEGNGIVSGVNGGICTIKATSVLNPNIYDEYLIYVLPDSKTMTTIISEIYQLVGSADFTALSDTLVDIVENSYHAIIGVSNYKNDSQGKPINSSLGTGMIYKKEDLGEGQYKYTVLTNNHVIDKADELKVYLQPNELYIHADLICCDSDIDLAVITFTSDIIIEPLEFAEEGELKTGSFVMAIGHPTGYDYYNSATFGIVSCAKRELSDSAAIYVQHDAAINNGNSGGPLLDMNGNIVGVNTLKLGAEGIDNVGLAVALETVFDFLDGNNAR